MNKFHTNCTKTPTYLVVAVAFMLRRIRLAQFILQLSVQIILCVHNIQVLIFMPVAFILLVLAGAADVIEHLPQLVTLGWSCERRHTEILYISEMIIKTHRKTREGLDRWGLVGIWCGSQSGEHWQQWNTAEDAAAATSVWAAVTSGEAATVAVVNYWRNVHNNGICWDVGALVSKQIRYLKAKHQQLADEWGKKKRKLADVFA